MKRFTCLFTILALALSLCLCAGAAQEDAISNAFSQTADYLTSLGAPTAGSVGGEWMVLGLARSGHTIADSYYDSALALIADSIDENGRLHPTKCTTNCRMIVALTAIGRDATDVGGYNLIAGLSDPAYVRKVGISGIIWTLIALDCGGYEAPAGLERQALVQELLDGRTAGGWAVSGQNADPDITAMALQALVPYRQQKEVRDAIDEALATLSTMQDGTGNFPGQYGTSSESVAQVIVALSALGIDANTDSRFVKDGVSAMDALLGYLAEGGGFRHIATGMRDGMATEQGFYALTAYRRMQEGKSPLYDMAADGTTPPSATQPTTPQAPAPAAPAENSPWLWCVAVLAIGAVLALLCLLLRRKLGRRRFSNAMMVLLIALIASLGIGFALQMRAAQQSPTLGSQYRITPIADNRLVTSADAQNLCTITVRCDTVLGNLSRLEQAKLPYIPADGVLLPTITVEFTPGESVFDILRRVCEQAQLALEYSWTPLYDSYYLEGIGHLYEFDCGAESGWMYQVNGHFPNYGCSGYQVQPGDVIEWRYTCVGLGTDLGATGLEGQS